MPDITTEPAEPRAEGSPSVWRRAGWFAVIWTGSLLAWLAFAYGLKWIMRQVGIAA
jgi:hypothetical protein